MSQAEIGEPGLIGEGHTLSPGEADPGSKTYSLDLFNNYKHLLQEHLFIKKKKWGSFMGIYSEKID